MSKNTYIQIENHEWVETQDGSYTLYSKRYNETCHSLSGAESETTHYYINGCRIEHLFKSDNSTVLEVGLGLGKGLQATLDVHKKSPAHKLHFISLEIAPELIEFVKKNVLTDDWSQHDNLHCYKKANLRVTIIEGDARDALPNYILNFHPVFDAIYQDAFSPKRNVELWTTQWFKLLRESSHDQTLMTTYSSSKAMRKSMIAGGWSLREGEKFGTKRSSTLAIGSGKTEQTILDQLERSPTPSITDSNRVSYSKDRKELKNVQK